MTQNKTSDEKYCQECGKIIRAKAEICPECGCRQPGMSRLGDAYSAMRSADNRLTDAVFNPSDKQRGTAILLAIFGGSIGLHKFYLGQTWQGVLYLVFCWTFIPLIFGVIEGLNMAFMSEDDFQSRLGTRLI
ncbi:MAG: TM2 domain-containing protein [Sulfuriferula sp.]